MAADKKNLSDKKLGDALMNLDLSSTVGSLDPQIERAIDSERRRMKWLTRATVGLWALAAAGALLVFVVGGLVFPMIAKLLQEAGEGSLEQPDTPFLMLAKLTAVNMVMTTFSFVVLVGAGLTTVLLIFRARRVTLGQINANLQQISEQINQLRLGGSGV